MYSQLSLTLGGGPRLQLLRSLTSCRFSRSQECFISARLYLFEKYLSGVRDNRTPRARLVQF